MKTADKILKARVAMILSQPFFATLALHLELQEDATCDDMWSDGRTLGYKPEYVEGLKPSELQGVIAATVTKCANNHHTRRGNRDVKRWNKACDFTVNPMILEAGFKLPKGALIDANYEGRAAEEIYKMLQKQEKEEQDKQGGKQPQDGQGKGNSNGCGEIRDAAPSHDKTALAAAESEWTTNVRQALGAAKRHNAGEMPGFLKPLDVSSIAPRIDWKSELRAFIDQSSVKEFSWSRPNRRFIGSGLILPGYVSDSLSHLILAIDDSSSIDNDIFNEIASEAAAALDDGAADRITVLFCNTAVHKVETFERGDTMKITARGNGGTKFSPVFQWVEDNAPDASCIVYLTDMDSTDYGMEPAVPVLWAAYGDSKRLPALAARAPFGTVINVDA